MGLFSRKKKDADANPYADGSAPFANPLTPYQQARNDLAQGKPVGIPSDPRFGSPAAASSTAPPSYHSPSISSSKSGGFANDQYGSKNGYGGDRYGNQSSSGPRAGGYGGFDEDAGKSDLFGGAPRRAPPAQSVNNAAVNSNQALFGNAQNRYDIRQQAGPMPPSQPNPAADDEYGGYGAPRELTAEEQEQQEVDGIHDEISKERDATIATLQRSIGAAQALESLAASTNAKLGEQGERLHNTEMKLNEAAIHSKDSADKTKELKQLNRSMFVPVAGNPFTRKKRERLQDEATLTRHQEEKQVRSEALRNGYQSKAAIEQQFNDMSKSQKARSKWDYVSDDDEEAGADGLLDEGESREERKKEAMIDQGIGELDRITRGLRQVAMHQGENIDRQIGQIDRITQQTDLVDDRVRMNREKLKRIR